jgi:hypothetical protein
MRLGDFVSLVEAEKAANETMRDLAELQSWKQLESELTHGMDLADDTLEQMIEAHLRQHCDKIAADLGMTELWQQSQTEPNFKKAWAAWRTAWEKWLGGGRRFPETKGPSKTRYLWEQKQCLAALRIGRGNKRDFYQSHAWLLFCAARLGDADFFKRFAEAERRKIEPRLVQHCLMTTWMPAALWSCSQDAVANFIEDKAHAWGGNPPANKGEAVRRAW